MVDLKVLDSRASLPGGASGRDSKYKEFVEAITELEPDTWHLIDISDLSDASIATVRTQLRTVAASYFDATVRTRANRADEDDATVWVRVVTGEAEEGGEAGEAEEAEEAEAPKTRSRSRSRS